MKENVFWHHLGVLVGRGIERLETCPRRGLWCDQFIPQLFDLGSKPGRITGHVWVGVGPREHEKWSFVLVLKQPVSEREEIDWSELLPPEGTSGWITVDDPGKTISLDPAVAVPR